MTGTVVIPLSTGGYVFVDEADAPRVSKYKWHRHGNSGKYAGTLIGGKWVSMHRLLLEAPAGIEVDHMDGNGLNNRRANIRLCTRSENNCNRRGKIKRQGFKGVRPHRSKFQALIKKDKKTHILGSFDDPLEARLVRNIAAIRLHGKFAKLS